MYFTNVALLGLATFLPITLAQIRFSGEWSITAYSENDCKGDNIGFMSGSFANDADGKRTGANGCLATTDGRVANSFYIDFKDTQGNGNGNTYVIADGFDGCSGPGTHYDGAHPGLERNSCQHTSASGCLGISKYQKSVILFSGDDTTCLGIAKERRGRWPDGVVGARNEALV
ncbi:hypothetical protein BP6252_05891 [Coleophoma cylindrospora]|uniref:Uncharacterized protein n=1 Tax=Coleophoma cylindrospora TaxID=1849047 RepID=A0A3D8RV31_9HELO|nr:hypothetical protein BP6252_05891 [Coleophoma cylindrospora]